MRDVSIVTVNSTVVTELGYMKWNNDTVAS